VNLAVLTHGSRLVEEDDPESVEVAQRYVSSMAVASVSNPSEPLQRALRAEAASHGGLGDAEGWGPGLYLDTEAVEALGRTPKNQPTLLEAAGATFYRAGS
jgi:hypothetical protein